MGSIDLRAAAQQGLEALKKYRHMMFVEAGCRFGDGDAAINVLEAALAEPVQEPDLSHCPKCGGPADNGHDRSIPPSPYWCTDCTAAVEEAAQGTAEDSSGDQP